jgi:CobQ-like glutamine amidotransferase family enzyme
VTSARQIGLLTGFENHRGTTRLGPSARPFGKVIQGVGNGDRRTLRRGTDGARTEHIIATYLHGPVLARNPALADHMLGQVTGRPMGALELPDQPAQRRTYLGR